MYLDKYILKCSKIMLYNKMPAIRRSIDKSLENINIKIQYNI